MSLFEQVKNDRIAALKARDRNANITLTTLVGEVQTALTRPKPKTADEETLRIIRSTIANIDFNLTKYTDEASIVEQKAAREILAKYLPTLMTEDQLNEAIDKALAAGFDNQGKINGYFKTNHAGKYDGAQLNVLIKTRLG